MIKGRFQGVDLVSTSAARHRSETILVDVSIDGQPVRLPIVMLLASALASTGILMRRHSPKTGAPRGAFCFMGACQECAISSAKLLAEWIPGREPALPLFPIDGLL
jgi:hypothetical protein